MLLIGDCVCEDNVIKSLPTLFEGPGADTAVKEPHIGTSLDNFAMIKAGNVNSYSSAK